LKFSYLFACKILENPEILSLRPIGSAPTEIDAFLRAKQYKG